jgi:putative transposase
VLLAQGQTTGEVCRSFNISEQTYYRWRKEYGGIRTDQVRRLKELEKENVRLKKLVADLSLDNSILRETVRGNSQVRPGASRPWNTHRRCSEYWNVASAGQWDNFTPPSDIRFEELRNHRAQVRVFDAYLIYKPALCSSPAPSDRWR